MKKTTKKVRKSKVMLQLTKPWEEIKAGLEAVPVRKFESGATRDTDFGKPDYSGFLSPIVIARFGEYMNKHRKQTDGSMRASDNWKKGIPKTEYLKSLWRHLEDVWLDLEGWGSRDGIEDALCGVLFNAQGLLHETLKETGYRTEIRP